MANRDRKKMSEEIFLRLFERALSLDAAFPLDLNARWVKRLSDDDAALMAKADFLPLKLSLLNSAAIIKYNGTSYFAVSGFNEPERLPPGLEPVESSPGLFGCFIFELKIDSMATASEIRDVVEGYSLAVDGYDGHDLDAVAALFPKVLFYKLDEKFSYLSSVERVLGSYLARGYAGGPLRLGESSRNEFADFFEGGSDWVPYALPLRGLLSFSWTGLYLELYRCIEQLYSIPRIVSLTAKWESSKAIFELSKILEESLSWRPREDEALELLFRDLDPSLCDSVDKCARTLDSVDSEAKPHKRAAKSVYTLRNSCVHFRPATQIGDMTDQKWNAMTVNLLRVVGQLYVRHGERFHIEKSA